MKKHQVLAIAAAFIAVIAVALAFSPLAQAESGAEPGDVIKGETHSTVYYLGEDGKRYVFPNGQTYFSWFEDFDHVKQISDEELMSHPLAGNVRYKPGSLLVKIQTDPKVYAVGKNGTLRWIKNEQIARGLYGGHWSKLVDDVPDSFFVNYNVGDPVADAEEFDPVEAENESPAIGYNLGLKASEKAQERLQKGQERRCQRWQKVTNRLKKRLSRLGMELPEDIGEEYLEECVSSDTGSQNQNRNQNGTASGTEKVLMCKVPPGNPNAAHTIEVGQPAVRAHLLQGSYLGACEGEEDADEEEGDEEEEENGDDEEEEDTEAPSISGVEVEVGSTTATVSWETDEDAASQLSYATSSLDEAATTESASSSDLVQEHSFDLAGLASSTTYYFVLESEDEAGNVATTSEDTFDTL